MQTMSKFNSGVIYIEIDNNKNCFLYLTEQVLYVTKFLLLKD